MVCGDARHLPAVIDPALHGLVALILTSLPYGPSLHGRVDARPGEGIRKFHNRYSNGPANLADIGLDRLLDAMHTILAGCARLLRPGGYVAMTVRPWWHNGELIDLPGALIRVGEDAGLTLFERNVALLAGLRDDHLVPRASFFALEAVRKARQRGLPRLVVAHEDFVVLQRPVDAIAAPATVANRPPARRGTE